MIIGFCGRKGTGKNLAGEIIRAIDPSFRCIAFADKLKQECADMLGVSVTEIETNKEFYRPFLQWYGTDFRRNRDPDYWIRAVESAIDDGNYCLTDIRFENEAVWVRSRGGVVVHVTGNNRMDATSNHVSETNTDGIACQYSVHNDGTPAYVGAVRDLYHLVISGHNAATEQSGGASHIIAGLMQAERLQEK